MTVFALNVPSLFSDGCDREFREAIAEARRSQLEHVHMSLRKYIEVLPAYVVCPMRI